MPQLIFSCTNSPRWHPEYGGSYVFRLLVRLQHSIALKVTMAHALEVEAVQHKYYPQKIHIMMTHQENTSGAFRVVNAGNWAIFELTVQGSSLDSCQQLQPLTTMYQHIPMRVLRGRPIIVEWERDARHSAGLSLVRLLDFQGNNLDSEGPQGPDPPMPSAKSNIHKKVKTYKSSELIRFKTSVSFYDRLSLSE
ncbi:hypothetical protein EVAR_98245_1 [Eumeta japonica]|uniref:Uncharacterized protein n=1 Tax=Eumeta variegata TaxID=151549 RepID=A0A4C1Y1A8_EUMVA|nr:hypothetical protein EVAR_98245_1 [Eumeta japonica]